MNRTIQICAAVALALTLSTPVVADPPADKGKGQSQGQSQYGDDSKHDGKDANHGQIVSECKHRANERNLKGKDRKEWTEWCEERGSRHNYDYGRYNTDRNCYQKADNKGLSGDKRRKFINDCLDRPNRY